MKTFTCEMKDGSIFRMPNKHWQKAYEMTYANDNQEDIKRIFIELVAKHWRGKTVPTKFGMDAKWGEFESKKKYKNHAEFGNEIMYIYIRAALMGIVFNKITGGKGKVIAISDDGKETQYPLKRKEGKYE